MAIDFRCENCGKLLSVEAEPSSKIKCPHCKAKVLVPAGLASLPRPQVPGDADTSEPRPNQPEEAQVEEEVLAPEGSDAMMGVMAALMPWVISLFFHAGILVILAFFAIIVVSQNKLKAHFVVPDVPISENLTENIAGDMNTELLARTLEKPDDQIANRDSKMTNMGETDNTVQIYGSAGGSSGGGARAPMGIPSPGGLKSKFFGTEGNAYHVVYVVDCSGSMLGEFEMVRFEIIKSISKLSPEQTFHIIFFSAGKPKENPPRRLVYAKEKNQRDALKYLKSVTPESTKGYTDPTQALKRAFVVLNRTPGKRKGKLINLLTDGEFYDNKKVISALRTLNAKGEVHINTVLFIFANAEAEQGLKQIAKENKGKFNFVERDE